jgi:hypothetical protein
MVAQIVTIATAAGYTTRNFESDGEIDTYVRD